VTRLSVGLSITGPESKAGQRCGGSGRPQVPIWCWSVALSLIAGILAGLPSVVSLPTALAAPGTPGVPQAPTVVYFEDFQNVPGPSPILHLNQYTGASGETYTADPQWLSNCNGWVASELQATTPAAQIADCTNLQSWNGVQQFAYALGVFAGSSNPAGNYAVSAATSADPGAGHVEFQTVNNIPFSSSNRFLTFSVDVAAGSCQAAHPLLQFFLLNSSGAATAVGSQIDGCSSTTTATAPAFGANGPATALVGTYTSNGALLFNGSSVGVRLVNNQASGTGNDHAFDNIRILDATPQLDKSLQPRRRSPSETSQL